MAKQQRLLVFVDEANVTRAASRNFNKSFDWAKFRDYLVNYGGTPRQLVEMVVYVGIPPDAKRKESRLRYAHYLKSMGFLVYTKEGQLKTYNSPRSQHRDDWYAQKDQAARTPREVGGYQPPPDFKANVDVIMAIDAVDLTLRIRPDVVTLVTGDSDFAHLALTIRREGIRVEVASAPQTLSSDLRSSANKMIDLTELFATFEPYEPKKPAELDPGPVSYVSPDQHDQPEEQDG
ncbi:MAG: NYN domain-containing protein [Deltaproteobacteria bacterium]|jgi:uncharacterized LabA/DUF88 family protein|nr:NYN domain-containing protein [Deltaproteobacteria bacterium]